MRRTHLLPALLVLLLGAASAAAQADAPPPPPPSPDYFPEKWKEYAYEAANVKFRFPAEPEVKTSETKESFGTVTSHTYSRRSFLVLSLSVNVYPEAIDLEKAMPAKDLLDKMRDGGLDEVKRFNPRVIKEADVTIDGHPGRFMQVEGDNGTAVRIKFFVVKNRMYFGYAEVKKGQRHGVNHENDFEKVALGFLDSIRLAAP
jgi:hypothetical protein